MAYEQLNGILEIANVFISLFVLIYAWSFLRQTADVRDRKPWVFLFIATVIFFAFEVIGVLDIFTISHIPGLRGFLESVFIALILFVFIFQYDLILKSDLILITRKIEKEESDEKEIKTEVEKIARAVEVTKAPSKAKRSNPAKKRK
jgi:hypothetical protein